MRTKYKVDKQKETEGVIQIIKNYSSKFINLQKKLNDKFSKWEEVQNTNYISLKMV